LNTGTVIGLYILLSGTIIFLITSVVSWVLLVLASQDNNKKGNYLFYKIIKEDKFFKLEKEFFFLGKTMIIIGGIISGIAIFL
jgi:hypothetical protein